MSSQDAVCVGRQAGGARRVALRRSQACGHWVGSRAWCGRAQRSCWADGAGAAGLGPITALQTNTFARAQTMATGRGSSAHGASHGERCGSSNQIKAERESLVRLGSGKFHRFFLRTPPTISCSTCACACKCSPRRLAPFVTGQLYTECAFTVCQPTRRSSSKTCRRSRSSRRRGRLRAGAPYIVDA